MNMVKARSKAAVFQKSSSGISKQPEPKDSMKEFLSNESVITWRAVMDAYRSVCAYLESALHENGYSCSRFQIFFLLYFKGPRSAAELAREQFVTRGNISMFLRRLVNEDLIEDFPAPGSQKRKLFRLTKKGRKEFELYFPKHVKRVESVVPTADSKSMKLLEELSVKGRKAKCSFDGASSNMPSC